MPVVATTVRCAGRRLCTDAHGRAGLVARLMRPAGVRAEAISCVSRRHHSEQEERMSPADVCVVVIDAVILGRLPGQYRCGRQSSPVERVPQAA